MARRKCKICGVREWSKNSVGQLVCKEGHLLENYRNETLEKDELGPHAMKKRAIKTVRERTKVNHDRRFYTGARARFLYWQCLQLVLRKQIAALIRVWELPLEFEIICRDLWALHLRLVPHPIPPEPLNWAREQGIVPESAAAESDDVHGESAEGSSSSSDSSSSEDDDQEEELRQLMLQAEERSDDEYSLPEAPLAGAEETKQKRKKNRTRYTTQEMPLACVAILVLACWTMRVPVMYQDFVELILRYELPYIDLARREIIPPSMLQHLDITHIPSLSPPYAPEPLALHTLTSSMARQLQTHFGIVTPPLNAAPLLWRTVNAFGGGPPLYAAAKRVGRALNLPLTLHGDLVQIDPLEKDQSPERRKAYLMDGMPEMAFAVTIIIVLKLVYGLDDQARAAPSDFEGLATGLPSMTTMLRALQTAGRQDEVRTRSYFDPQKDVLVAALDDMGLDALLDLSEKALLPAGDDHTGMSFSDVLGIFSSMTTELEDEMVKAYFPRLGTAQALDDVAHGSETQVEVSADEMDGSDTIETPLHVNGDQRARLPPGAGYCIYDARDVLGSAPSIITAVIERAATWVGVGVDDVYSVLSRYERLLLRGSNVAKPTTAEKASG